MKLIEFEKCSSCETGQNTKARLSFSDKPEHCGTCGLFLRNPLTAVGEQAMRYSMQVNRKQWRYGSTIFPTEYIEQYEYLWPGW